MVTEEIEGVLGVDVPLVRADGPIRRSLRDIRLPHQRVFRHRSIAAINREWITGIWPEFTHHVNQQIVVVQRNHVVSVEPGRLADEVAQLKNLRRRIGVHDHEHPVGLNRPLKLLVVRGFRRTIVPRFDPISGQVDGHRRGIVELNGLVVGVALDVFADENLFAKASTCAVQNIDRQRRRRQTVAFDARDALESAARGERRFVKSTEGTDAPNFVVPDAEIGEIVLRVRGRVEDGSVGIGDEEHVLGFDSFGGVPEGDDGIFLAHAAQRNRGAARVGDVSSVTRWRVAGLSRDRHRIVAQGQAARSGNVVERFAGRNRGQVERAIVRHRPDRRFHIAEAAEVGHSALEGCNDEPSGHVHNDEVRGGGGHGIGIGEVDQLHLTIRANR